MKVFIGADHRGFQLKETLESWLSNKSYEVIDCGNFLLDTDDDYPDFAFKVADNVSENDGSRGILLCGSGIGMTIAANKITGICAGLCGSKEAAVQGRRDDNINILCLAADTTDEAQAKDIVGAFLTTDFTGEERFVRRIKKIEEREKR